MGSGGVWGAAVGAERSALPVGWGNGVGGSGAARMGLSSAAVGCDGGIGSLLLRRGGDAVPSALSAPRDGPSNSFYFRCPPTVGPFIKAELSSSSSAPSFGVGRSSPRRITEPFRASPPTLPPPSTTTTTIILLLAARSQRPHDGAVPLQGDADGDEGRRVHGGQREERERPARRLAAPQWSYGVVGWGCGAEEGRGGLSEGVVGQRSCGAVGL